MTLRLIPLFLFTSQDLLIRVRVRCWVISRVASWTENYSCVDVLHALTSAERSEVIEKIEVETEDNYS